MFEGRGGREKQAAEIGLVAAPSSAACCLACRVIAATSVTVKNAKEFLCHFQSLDLPKFPSLELKFCRPGQYPKKKRKKKKLFKEHGKSDLTTTEHYAMPFIAVTQKLQLLSPQSLGLRLKNKKNVSDDGFSTHAFYQAFSISCVRALN